MGNNKKKLFIIVFIVVILIIGAGCSKGDSNIPKEEPKPNEQPKEEHAKKELTVKDVYPLNQGDYWKFAGTGNEYASFEQKVLFREGERIQIQNATGGTVMGIIYEFQGDKLVVVYSQEEFYEEENILDRENEMAEVILQEPIKVGNSWESGDKKYIIESVDTTVDTPAGQFKDCIKISVEAEEYNSKSFIYYKPGLGLIKQEFVAQDYHIVAELEEYKVKTFNN
ncbi:MAG: hypothetical protein ACOYVD_04165 [Bacillota bacterium]